MLGLDGDPRPVSENIGHNQFIGLLHDGLGSRLSIIIFALRAMRARSKDDDLALIEEAAIAATCDLRALIKSLRMSGTDPLPSGDLVDLITRQLRLVTLAGMPVTLEISGTPAAPGPRAQLLCERLVREALANALKYCNPGRVEISIDYEEELHLHVKSTAMDVAAKPADREGEFPGGGLGLRMLEQEIRSIGGYFMAGRCGTYFLVSAHFPVALPAVASS